MTFPFIDLPNQWGSGIPPTAVTAIELQARIDANLNLVAAAIRGLPQGNVGGPVAGPSAQTDYSTGATVVSVTVPTVAGRNYQISGVILGTQITAAGIVTVKLAAASAELGRILTGNSYPISQIAGNSGSATFTASSTGSVLFAMTVQDSAGAFRVAANAAQMTVVDLGS